MIRRLVPVVVAVVAASAGPGGRAVASSAGTVEAGELDVPASALAAVAGGAAAGLCRDATAVTDNPARLAVSARAGVAASHAIRPLGITDTGAFGFASGEGLGVLGAHLRVVRAELDSTVEDGAGAFGGPGSPIRYQTVIATVAAAPDLAALTEGWPVTVRAGAGVTVVRRELAGTIVTGFGGTAAAAVQWPAGLSVWLLARDVGLTAGTGWPGAVGLGAGWERAGLLLEDDRLAVAGTGGWSREGGAGGSVAVEYGAEAGSVGAALRAGWSQGMTRSVSPWPSAGLVLRAAAVSLEAAVVPMGGLGWMECVTISYQESRGAE